MKEKKERLQQELKQKNLSSMRRKYLQRGLANIDRLINLRKRRKSMLKNNKQREEYIRNEDNWKLTTEHPDGFRIRTLEIGSLIFYKFEIMVPTFYKLKDSDPDTHWVSIGIYMKDESGMFKFTNQSANAMVTAIKDLRE